MSAGKKTKKNADFYQNDCSIKCASKVILLMEEEKKKIGGCEKETKSSPLNISKVSFGL